MNGFLHRHKRRLLGAAACLALLLLLLWWLWPGSNRTQLGRVEMLTHLALESETNATAPAQRRELWNGWQRELESLPPALKKEFWSARGETWRAWLREFFRASKMEQSARLREVLEQIAAFRRQWDGSGGPDWWDQLGPLEREARLQQWLSMTAPEDRALVDGFLRLLAAEAQSLGTTVVSPWGDDAPT